MIMTLTIGMIMAFEHYGVATFRYLEYFRGINDRIDLNLLENTIQGTGDNTNQGGGEYDIPKSHSAITFAGKNMGSSIGHQP